MATMTRTAVLRFVTEATPSVSSPTGLASRPQAGQSGMTLAEILVAMAIIAIGLVGLMAIIPQSATSIQTGNTVSTATFLTNNRIDFVKTVGLPALANPTATPPIPANPGYLGTYDVTTKNCTGIANDPITPLAGTETDVSLNGYNTTGYSRTTQVSDVAGTGPCFLKLVTVSTSYRGAPRATISIQISPR